MAKLPPEIFHHTDSFLPRHLGLREKDVSEMLKTLKIESLNQVVSLLVPEKIRLENHLRLGAPRSEFEVLDELRQMASENQVFKSYIGMGYSSCITPPVIQRNILENPGWYTQYTPYQAEIAQGRLEALLNFQTMIADFTGLPVANASLLDESTAAAEAMAMCFGIKGRDLNSAFFVSKFCHPQTISVVQTRAEPLGLKVIVDHPDSFDFKQPLFGALLQYPTTEGIVPDYSKFISRAKESGSLVVIAADLLSLALLKSPADLGADIAVGSTQRFGVPLGYGGPHAAYFATRDEYKRQIPGRIVGMSQDSNGRPAIRLALQTREQHIRRDKATSNICTSQVLLAIVASMYAVYHGPKGIRKIAERVYGLTLILREALRQLGYDLENVNVFDTLKVPLSQQQFTQILEQSKIKRINLRLFESHAVGMSLDETTSEKDLADLIDLFSFAASKKATIDLKKIATGIQWDSNSAVFRGLSYLTHPVFNTHQSETEMLRYIYKLQSRDLSLAISMIPLGSCTMKLNATSEMLPITWNEFSNIHPFVPLEQTKGYQKLFKTLEGMLAELTGFPGISLQPNAGSQGEYAGLLVIRKYHQSRGDSERTICLIPRSAHGTNPASAAMAGMKVVVVDCDSKGNIDFEDLKAKATAHRKDLAALMVTYPSTHGVFEETIQEICAVIHDNGGQVYMDGANMNAQIGLCRPGEYGPDVCHLNLHKTFCIPHGGGGPGMGPIGVARHLIPFLPSHPVVSMGIEKGIGPVSAAPWGSPSILPIPWMYISMMGAAGLTKATQHAILSANYIARRLEPYYPVLFRGENNLVAHECIFDLRPLKERSGVDVEDVAKRLMDYGFHAPTISFPVAGTMMVEPTESESKAEIDRFCTAMIQIREEIGEIIDGKMDRQNNLLKNAPHTAGQVTQSEWTFPYSRERAAFPAPWVKEFKFWPAVGRINNVLGDRNLICSCPPIEDYA